MTKTFLIFDSYLPLANRTARFLPIKNYYCCSYENPFEVIYKFITHLGSSFIRKKKLIIITSGFRMPDILVICLANRFGLTSIYVQHGFFLTHLKRSKYLRNPRSLAYLCYLLLNTFLFLSPIKLYYLYKKGKPINAPHPKYSFVYNEYWKKFHAELLGWDKSHFLELGTFDLSRNRLDLSGKIK